jgi:glucose-1-phosphate thymidylyltransferase
LLEASSFIATLQRRQGLQVSCPEEIAYFNSWISKEELLKLATPLSKTNYGGYLLDLVNRS